MRTDGPPRSEEGTAIDYARRRGRAQAELARLGVDHLMVGPSADLIYLTGYNAHNFERPTLLVVPRAGAAFLLVPELEADKARAAAPDVEARAWGDAEDPWAVLRAGIGSGPYAIAVSDVMRASFALMLQQVLPGSTLRPAGELMGRLRERKEPGEIAALREAAGRTDAVFDRLCGEPLAGRTETEVADLIGRHLKTAGLAWKWSYICSVASGEHSASPHHTLSDRTLRAGDAVCVDFGGTFAHYPSDLTRTMHIGPPPDEFRRVYAVVQDAQERAFRAVRPGVTAEQIDRAARDTIAAAGYGEFFLHRTGHGLGLEIHETPYIVAGNGVALAPGMVFSIEPGVYLPGKFGVRIEDTVVVTDGGAERLNGAEHDLRVVR
jgi:Xaa-Pro aminopeptidase